MLHRTRRINSNDNGMPNNPVGLRTSEVSAWPGESGQCGATGGKSASGLFPLF